MRSARRKRWQQTRERKVQQSAPTSKTRPPRSDPPRPARPTRATPARPRSSRRPTARQRRPEGQHPLPLPLCLLFALVLSPPLDLLLAPLLPLAPICARLPQGRELRCDACDSLRVCRCRCGCGYEGVLFVLGPGRGGGCTLRWTRRHSDRRRTLDVGAFRRRARIDAFPDRRRRSVQRLAHPRSRPRTDRRRRRLCTEAAPLARLPRAQLRREEGRGRCRLHRAGS